MTTNNSTVIKLKKYRNTDENFCIDTGNQKQVIDLLKSFHGLKSKLDTISIQSMPTDNPQLIALISEISALSKASTKMLTEIDFPKIHPIPEKVNGIEFEIVIPKILMRQAG
jgi:hypothetical protein